MKLEEAIFWINDTKYIYENMNPDIQLSRLKCEAFDLSVQALEKQIPLKPQLESDGYSDGELVYDTWICPKCGKDYEIDCHDYKCCPECGQRIDRGDIE